MRQKSTISEMNEKCRSVVDYRDMTFLIELGAFFRNFE